MNPLMDATEPYLLNAVFPPLSEFEPYVEGQHLVATTHWSHSSDNLRVWLRMNITEWDLAPTTWAKRAGIAPSTINRFLDGDDKEASLSARTVRKLASVIQEEVAKRAQSDLANHELRAGKSEKDVIKAQFLGPIGDESWQKVKKPRATDDHGPYDIRVASISAPYTRNVVGVFEINTDIHSPIFNKNDEIFCSPISKSQILPNNNQFVILIDYSKDKMWRGKLLQYVQDPANREWLLPVGEKATREQVGIFLNSFRERTEETSKIVFTVVGHYRHLNGSGPLR